MKRPRLAFHGAAGGVTGSCFRLAFAGTQVLVDCGLFQGAKSEKELNYRPFPFTPRSIDAAILTHAHVDHSGLVPKLVKSGFAGPIHAAKATVDLCSAILPDTGYVQETEVRQLNRRNLAKGREAVEPIYTAEDAVACLTRFRPVDYGAWFQVAVGIRARLWNAGHLLGSSSLEVELAEARGPGRPMRLLFSGDIGPTHKLFHEDPEAPSDVDYLVCESTYGGTDRVDASADQRRRALRDVVRAADHADGALLIPSFAVERTQELLIDLYLLMRSKELPWVPIFIDSPLATKASAVFDAHAADLRQGELLRETFRSRHVHFTESVEQSKAIGRTHGFHIVIAGSGMCEAGRIRHHLKDWLWRDEATVLLVGYQAQGTLGRILQDGAARVRIQDEEIAVRARIRSLDLYSGHADAPELSAWIEKRRPIRLGLFLVHGEAAAVEALKLRVAPVLPGVETIVPALDSAYELTGSGARELGKTKPPRLPAGMPGHMDWHNDLTRLVLDITSAIDKAADERSRNVIIRRIRRALEPEEVERGASRRR
ncbi:MAG: MBL fold metallo-hydrolase [Alphaproteobacteria bacterium]|nr:MBL fold metallo-hydrolase [Alphaproteobacteria bacterium]